MKRSRFVFSGSGGQGIITAAIILAEAAAIYNDLEAVQSQSYGPEARGGSARSDVIISDKPIYYPKVTQPNILICLSQDSYNKYHSLIRPGGILITDSNFVAVNKITDAAQKELPMHKAVMENIGNPIVFNICMLGALVKLTDIVKIESIISVLKKRIPDGFLDMNIKALELGQSLI